MADEKRWMQRAWRLAARGWGKVSPNPLVGCVIVAPDGTVVGEGWHQCAGGPHAEVHALRQAGEQARGATLHVTLEPCSTHGRTPPCTEAIQAAGVGRVVVGMLDPNPAHAGRGREVLHSAGIPVTVGVETARCAALNEAFACWIRHRRPYVVLKLAMTLDGKIATRHGESKWITGPVARQKVQRLRRWADALLVGAETVRQDDPSLLVRTPVNWERQPLRLVATRSGELGENPRVLNDGLAPTRLVRADGADAWRLLLARLGSESITALLVEGGGALAGELLAAGCVDKVVVFVAPRLLGGEQSRPAVGGPGAERLADALPVHEMQTRRCGADLMITGYLTDVHRYC